MVASSPIVSLAAGLLLAVAAPAAAQDAPLTAPTSCAAGLQIFVARGSTEAPGLGKIRTVAGNVTAAIPDSFVTAVDYPATFDDYANSVAAGSLKMKELVEGYVAMCPTSKIALLGYSQGAQAVGDLICGASSVGMAYTLDLDAKYNSNIIAMILFGDPTRSANQTFNLGTSTTRNGLFPRLDNDACEPYSPRLRSWCDTGDVYCDVGVDRAVHGTYFDKYTTAATEFVVAQWKASQQAVKPRSTVISYPTGSNSTWTVSPTATGAPAATTTSSRPPSIGAASANGKSLVASVAVALGVAVFMI